MGYRRTTKTEHSGAKRGRGFWGRKVEAKKVSRKRRRAIDKDCIKEEET